MHFVHVTNAANTSRRLRETQLQDPETQLQLKLGFNGCFCAVLTMLPRLLHS